MATVALVILTGLGLILWRFIAPNSQLLNSANNDHTADNFGPLDIPLNGLSQNGQLSLNASKALNINGQLKVNSGFVIAPSDQPVQGVAGQMYYDRATNQLNYYNGSGFVALTGNPQTVTSINGTSGAITLGGGLSLNGSQLTNNGIVSITSASTNLAIANDGNGNVTVSTTGGAVQSNNGTPGSIALFSDSQTITSSILSQSGSTVTIAGAASINGGATVAGTLNLMDSGTQTINLTETTSGVTGQIYNDGNLHITGGSNNLWLDAGGNGTIFVNAGNSNKVAINESVIPLYPLEVNGDINITAGHSYRIGGTVICSISGCIGPSGGGVSSLNGLSGALTVANATASGSTITLDDASTSQKGIASFNSTNFTVTSGAVNTIQNIDPTANPTFVGINTSAIVPNGTPLTVGSNTQDLTLQGTNVLMSRISGGNSTTLTFAAPTANVTYRLQTAAAGTYDVCTTVGNCVGVGGTVSTTGGTTNRLTKFTGAQTLGDSIVSDNGSVVTIAGDLSVTGSVTFTNPLPVTSGGTGAVSPAGARLNLGAASSGANSDITSITGLTTALGVTQGGTGAVALTANGVLLGNGTSAISSLVAASANLCLVSTAGAPTWQSCPGGGGVSSVNGLIGALTIANASAADSTITINDASTSQKGIAQFDSTNFSVTSGVVNTIQDIAVSSTPTFGRLTVTSSQATNGMLLVNNTNGSGTGNLIDLQLAGTSKFAVTPAGALTLSSTINGQTISSAANLTGSLTVAGVTNINGAANLNAGATVAGTLTANTITPTGALTVGATSQSFTVQGNASSTIAATNGGNTTTLAFQTPTASVTYRLLTAAAGTYDICTTVGNCAGVGGGVTTTGGTTNSIAKFTGTGSIGDSIITDNGTTVTIGGTLSVNTITPAAAMSIGATTQNLTLQGAVTKLTATNGGVTNTLAFATPATSDKTITIPNATGTVAVSASGPLSIDASGNISCPTCVTSGGGGGGVGAVDSVDGLTGALTIANSSGSGTIVTINDASTSQKGIAQFNSTNFSASSGVINTIQNINTAAAPTFGQLTLSSSQSSATMLTVNNTNVSATGNLVDLKLNGTSEFAVTSGGNVTLNGTINGQTISSTANFTGTVGVTGNLSTSASLFANAAGITTNLNVSGTTTTAALSVTNDAGVGGNLNVTGTVSANTITPTGALTVGATSLAFTLQGNASSSITATGGGFTTTVGFTGTATGAVTYNFDRAATPGTYTICTTVGNCAGTGGGVTTPGGTTNTIAKFTGAQTLGNSNISDDGSAVTIAVPLKTNTITPTGALTIGATGQNLTLQGAAVSLTATSAGITNSLTFATPATSNKTITIPNASGTVAVSASGVLSLDANGNVTCPSCVTGTAVSSLNSQTGAVTLANAVGSGGVVTINDASTSQKGIASFNSTNFSASGGVINTIQDINTTAAPTFGRLTVTSNQGASDMFVVNNTNTSTTGSLIKLQLNGADKFTVDSAGNVVAAGTITSGNVNGQTISSAANFTGSVAIATTLNVNTITPTGALTIGATNQNITLQGATTRLSATATGITSTLTFATPTTSNKTITIPDLTGTVCLDTGNCLGAGGGANAALSNLSSVAINTSLLPGAAGGVNLGSGTLPFGSIYLSGASGTPGTNNFLLTGTSTSGTRTITFPDATGTVCLQGNSNCNFAPSTGGNGYIQNGTSLQTANFAIQSSSGSNIAAVIRGAASQSAAIFQVQNGGGTPLFTVWGGSNDIGMNDNVVITGQGSTSDIALIVKGNASQNSTNIVADFRRNDDTSLVRVGLNADIYLGNSASGIAGSVNIGNASGNYASFVSTPLTTNRTITIPDATGTICLSTNNCTVTLQNTYAASTGGTTPEIKLDTTRNGVDIQDADSTLGSSVNYMSFRASNSGGLGSIVFGWGVAGTYFQKPTSDSLTAFQVQTSGGNNLFTVDSTNGRVGINLGGSLNPSYTLEVKGDLNVGTGVYRSSGTAGLTATTCSGGQVLQNQVVTGGIVTGGTCAANDGSLQTAYNASTNPELVLDATRGALTIRDNATPLGANLLEIQNNGGSTNYLAVSASQVTTGVPLRIATTSDSTTLFNVKNSLGNNVFSVDSTNTRVGIGLGGNNTPTLTNEGLEILGSLRLSGSASYYDLFHTPAGADVTTRINIPTFTPSNFGQVVAMGLPSGAVDTTRVLSLFDARTIAHQPTLAVFTPDENNLVGFSWEGSNTNAYLKTTGGNLVMRSGSTDLMTLLSGGNVGIGVSPSYKLDVAGAVNVSSGNTYKIAGVDICTSSGCTPASGSGNYIQNQNSAQQTSSNFWISGTGRADTALQAPSLDTATAAGTLTVAGTNATTVSIATGAVNGKTINLGSVGSTANSSTVNIANTSGNATQLVNIGSTSSASNAVLVQGGTSSTAVQIQAGSGGQISIANNAVAQTVNVGNTTGATAINLTSGSGGLTMSSTGTTTVKQSGTATTTTFQVQNVAATNTALDVDALNGRVGINTSSPTTMLQANQSALSSGTVSNSAGGTTVTGSGTSFLSKFQAGDTLTITSTGNTCTIQQINSDTSLVCTATLASLSSGSAYSFTQQTRLSVADNGLTTVGGTLSVSNPGVNDQYSIRVNTSTGGLNISANTIGNTSTGINFDIGNNGTMSASQYNSGTGGTVSTLRVYFPAVDTAPNNHVKVAIYSDSSGAPGTRLSSATAPSTTVTAATWTNVSLGQSVTLTPNTNYWLVFNVDGANTTYGYSNGAAGAAKYIAMTYSSNFPSSFGTPTSSGSAEYTVYAPYTSVSDTSQTKSAVSVDSNNNVLFKPNWDSSSAFKIQRASGTDMFVADTANDYVGTDNLVINGSFDSNYRLTVGGAANITGNLNVGTVSGAGLTDCSSTNSKLLWSSSTKQFSCGTDRASVTIRKSADESVTSSTTLQNDDQLTFSIGANETYIVHITMNATMVTGGAGSIKYTLTAPSGATCNTSAIGADGSGTSGEILNGSCGTTGAYGGSGTSSVENIDATITTGATSGSVTLQWAQNTSNGTATRVKAGSSLVAYKVSGADLAEAYYTKDNTIVSGDVVSMDPTSAAGVNKSTNPYDTSVLGVISTNPGQVLADPSAGSATGRPVLVALSGRIPVKVSTENGVIHAGDFLTTSSTPGAAMKATRAGQVIGRALSGYDGPGTGTVLMFASQQWADPHSPDGSETQTDTLQNASLAKLTTADATIDTLTVNKNAEFKGDMVVHGSTSVVDLTVNGHIITGGSKPTIAHKTCDGTDASIDGTDTAGLITITTPAGCNGYDDIAAITFSKAFAKAPRVTITPANADATNLKTYVDSDGITPTSFTIATPTNIDGSKTYRWYYQVLQ